ncbi:hypothetical protein D3C81_1634410 [compost metagenome]
MVRVRIDVERRVAFDDVGGALDVGVARLFQGQHDMPAPHGFRIDVAVGVAAEQVGEEMLDAVEQAVAVVAADVFGGGHVVTARIVQADAGAGEASRDQVVPGALGHIARGENCCQCMCHDGLQSVNNVLPV